MRLFALRVSVALSLVCLASCGPSSGVDMDGGGNNNNGDGDGGGGCQGASCQNKCPAGTMTTVSGVVRMPNGIDPVPQALVYVPREVTEFPDSVRCEVCDQITDIAIVSTQTADDGSFTLGPIPTSENQQPGILQTIIAQKGRFRRLAEVTINNVCAANDTSSDTVFNLPGANSGYNNIPNIAVATGDYDVMECVLLKLGLEQGSFDLYNGVSLTPTPGVQGNLDALLMDVNKMKTYNIIFINCAGNTYESVLGNATVKANIKDYVLSGGRLYVTDWSYDYVEQIDDFAPLIDFGPDIDTNPAAPEPMNAGAIGDGDITTEAAVLDDGMRRWLEAVEAVTGTDIVDTQGRVHIDHFLVSWVMQAQVPANENSEVWLTGQVTGSGLSGDLPLTTTFDYAQCGRVLYSSYHTAGRDIFGASDFPSYCSSDPLSPQERVLEYLILHVADCIDID